MSKLAYHGNKTSFKKGNIPWNKGLKGCRAGISNTWKIGVTPWNKGLKGFLAGETHYNWKGGISSVSHKLRTSRTWKEWRTKVFNRDDYTCQKCKRKGGFLHPHHLKSVKECIATNNIDLVFEVDNGQTLCKECHMTLHGLNKRGD